MSQFDTDAVVYNPKKRKLGNPLPKRQSWRQPRFRKGQDRFNKAKHKLIENKTFSEIERA